MGVFRAKLQEPGKLKNLGALGFTRGKGVI